MKCFVSLCALVALGGWLPPSANAMVISDGQKAVGGRAAVVAMEPEQPLTEAAVSGVSIDERLQSESGAIAREYTFTGNTNEVVVLYVENTVGTYNFGSHYPETLDLYGPTGQRLQEHYDYPEDLDFEETEGTHLVFLLPESGTYRLVFEAVAVPTEGDDTPVPVDFLLRARVADYFERLMISAYENFNAERYEDALSLLALATEAEPASPASYLARLFTYSELLFETPDFYTQLDALDTNFESAESENELFALVHGRFSTLESEEQSLVLSDLRLLEGLYKRAIANGETVLEDGFEPSLFVEIAEFLETGVPNNTMQRLLFGTSEG